MARFRNLSIGTKIFGVSVALLSIMLAAAIYTYIQTTRVRDASHDLTAILIPLAGQIGTIETITLEQALMLERANRHFTTEDSDPELAKSEVARFQKLNADVDVAIPQAQQAVKSGLEKTAVVEDAAQIARLEPELGALKRDHERYSAIGIALIEAVSAAKPDAWKARMLEEQLSASEDTLDETIDRLTGLLRTAETVESERVSSEENDAYLASTESLTLAIVAFLTGSLLSALITRRMVKPVQALISGAEEVTRGNLDVTVEVHSKDEIGRLSLAFQNMITELRSKARIKETFGKYLDPRVVERLLGDGLHDFGVGEKAVMTVFFSDLQGFSKISESLTAAGLVKLINSYLTLASAPIVGNGGVIDKYIGDAIMAFWGPPFHAASDHARRACVAALAQQEQLAELKRQLPEILGIRKNLPEMKVRIGLCTGELIVGSIGSNISKSFTVMGDTVNTASRLESANKQFGTRILIDGLTFDMVRTEMEARELDLLGVVGKDDPVRVYELLGEKGKVEAGRLELRDLFEAGLRAYRAGDLDLADCQFEMAAAMDPSDKPVELYRERVRRFRETPPPPGWDGVWRLTEK
jgi:class 3 adenylate cyclase